MMQKLLLTVVAVAALAGGVFLAGQMNEQTPVQGRVFEPSRVIKPFELTDHNGETLTNRYFEDHWTLIFLGYTHCPDVCPTTLAKLANTYPKLKDAGIDNIQVLFVSVDPKRDDAARLKEYTAYFNEAFTAASGPHSKLFPFVRSLGLIYSMTEDTSQPEYDVGHSGGIVLVNPQGALHALFQPESEVGAIPNVNMANMRSDIQTLVKRF